MVLSPITPERELFPRAEPLAIANHDSLNKHHNVVERFLNACIDLEGNSNLLLQTRIS
jgi:hypothetical protein